ncbi:N-acetylglucosamine-1-phosphotransferase subunit gamma isoform X1 [Octopus sinensis]|uniref:N-acetylglucosamine-1-phosphotransferase subunit gamma isoform X1 n=1 Tax=Octopus sinensis TaxID=2607531 RepID=A0A6P7SSY3_9MOLL|nr:N-acetylglucosamine-1-phosphotransferase subunit gamma isoform X1 [Octopus sinensis]
MKTYVAVFLTLSCVLLLYLNCCDGKTFDVKLLEEPSGLWSHNEEDKPLVMQINPANFSGPPHFRSLIGKCFNKSDNMYQYKFCPFFNVTQHELSLRWNPYNGILGVWQDWEIANNTFTAMLLKEGDKCGSISRTSRVVFECAPEHQLKNVSEPRTCEYLFTFQTPFVCHPNAMLVYPTLEDHLRDAWDELEGQYVREEITKKGYNKELTKIFQRAGFIQTGTKPLSKKSSDMLSSNNSNTGNNQFTSLEQCTAAFNILQAEIEGLRTLLMLKEVKSNDNVANTYHSPKANELSAWTRYKFPFFKQKRPKQYF